MGSIADGGGFVTASGGKEVTDTEGPWCNNLI